MSEGAAGGEAEEAGTEVDGNGNGNEAAAAAAAAAARRSLHVFRLNGDWEARAVGSVQVAISFTPR